MDDERERRTGVADAQAPEWVSAAWQQMPTREVVRVCEVDIKYRAWGRRGQPLIVLVHGAAAHAGWWDHLAPYLAREHRVVAVDLSGHGDSGRRPIYHMATWASEVRAVTQAESDQPALLVGHSLGGFVSLTAAAGSDLFDMVVVVDSPIKAASERVKGRIDGSRLIGTATYADRASILDRFRFLPQEDRPLPYLQDYVAAGSVVQVDGRWSWKVDPQVLNREPTDFTVFAQIAATVVLVLGQHGMATPAGLADFEALLHTRLDVTTVMDAGHHILLDQPSALLAVLQLIADQRATG